MIASFVPEVDPELDGTRLQHNLGTDPLPPASVQPPRTLALPIDRGTGYSVQCSPDSLERAWNGPGSLGECYM